jgi:predicted nucleotidyltransferase
MRHNWTSKTLAQINVPEAEIADFCNRNGIRRLAFFGSILTNRFSDSSDIDILVEFQPTQRVGFFRLAEMEAELSRILGRRRVDVRTCAMRAVATARRIAASRCMMPPLRHAG